MCQILFERLGILQWTETVPTRQWKSKHIDIQCWVVSIVRKMKRNKEVLEHRVKQGIFKEEIFEQRPEWSERGAMWPWWWCWGEGEWFWAERITFLNICYVSGPVLEALEMAVKRLLNISIIYCLIVQSVLSMFCIIPFFNCLIFWNWKIPIRESPFVLPTACHFFLFFLGAEPLDFYCLDAPNTVGYWLI